MSSPALTPALETLLGYLDSCPNLREDPVAQKILVAMLRRVKPAPEIPGLDIFLELSSKMVPSFIDLIILNDEGQVFMTWRECSHFKGWHIPGGMRLPRTTLLANAQDICNRELGGPVITSLTDMGTIDQEEDPRMHHTVRLFHAEIQGKPCNGRWFSEMPDDIIPIHRIYWPHIGRVMELESQRASLRAE